MAMYLTKERNYTKPTSLLLEDLELEPYQYREDTGYDESLTITVRVVLSEAQYAMLGTFPPFIKVVRGGIDEEPREMEIVEIAWSKSGNEIKEEICLYDKSETPSIPIMGWQFNLARLAARQSIILDGLINHLTTRKIIDEEAIHEIKSNISEGQIWEKQRELNHVKDLDIFKSIESEE